MKHTIVASLKVGSHDPIFASNYSSALFFRQQLDVRTPIFDKFPAVFVYWMKIEHVLFSSNQSKEPPTLDFPTLNLAKYFYKMAATAGSSCGEAGFSSSSRSNWMQKTGSCEQQQFLSLTQKFSMLIGSKLDLVNRP